MDKFNVIVLAGDRGADDPMAMALGVKRKALLEVHNKTMLSYVLDALKGADNIGDVFIVANQCSEIEAALDLAPYDELGEINFIEGKTSPATSLNATLEENAIFPALIVTADCPLLTPQIINEFIKGVQNSDAEILIGFATETNINNAYPEGRRTYLRFKGEGYSGCNIFTFRSANVLKVLEFWAGLEKDRKKAFKVLGAFGFWNMLLILLRRIDIYGAFKRASASLGVSSEPIILSDPNAAIDVDRPQHIAIVEKILEKRNKLN